MVLFEEIVRQIVAIINSLGYMGVALGMMLESACIPLPSEIVLPLGGNMVLGGRGISLLGVNIAAAVGSMVGSIIAYLIGYYGGRPFILNYGKYFFVSLKHFHLAEKTFLKYGASAVFFGRLLPVIRTFISLPAGIAKLDFKKFLIFSFIGMIPWNALLIYLGFKFGQNYATIIRPIFHKFEYIVIGGIALIIMIVIVKQYTIKKDHSVKK
ncbi:SNARE associated Golgi protein-like protein [Syntrophobotulus glycolicus DSM 8271]|uniref:SNARE associated Golgi protein-like protein n=1 Tax=Syntrophobotulus glycolicus (strain DSM 8271 / FlGlyR) TaxID=645991 RepID=F0T102_SYNGF|nr:DedA family protein [Syntrophobotulus glycolicus]ADY57373.1 SNARE associated Golgi protein-like protein [Syntrophobotulus glycolicus DSM 8271]